MNLTPHKKGDRMRSPFFISAVAEVSEPAVDEHIE